MPFNLQNGIFSPGPFVSCSYFCAVQHIEFQINAPLEGLNYWDPNGQLMDLGLGSLALLCF